MTEPINASKNVCTCHKPTKKGTPAKLNQHIIGFYTAILFFGDESLIGKVVKINPYLCNLSLRTLNIFHFRPDNALNMSVHRLLNRCSGLVASEKIRHAASKVSNMLTAHICILSRRWVGSRSVVDNIEPLPNMSQSVLRRGILLLIASTVLSVGFVRLLKMLLNDAADIPMKLAKVC